MKCVRLHRIDLYYYDQKLAVENDENSHKDKNIDYEIKIQQGIGKNLILSLLELILTKKTLMLLRLSIKYLEVS